MFKCSVGMAVVAAVALVSLSLMYDVPNFSPTSICGRGFFFLGDKSLAGMSTANDEVYVFQGLAPIPNFTLAEAFYQRMTTVDVSQVTSKVGNGRDFKSRFLPNLNVMEYPVLAMENVCIHPSGALLVINVTHEDLNVNITGRESSIPELYYTWTEIYNCTGNISTDYCVGVMTSETLPEKHSFFPGSTVHLHPYVGNSFHNFAERVWPFIAASSPPLNQSTHHPWHHFLIHRFDKWFAESAVNADRETLLWQFRMLMEFGHPASDYLLVQNQVEPACFERLLLQMHDRDRMDQTRLPPSIYNPAMRKFRSAVLKYFNVREPLVRLPPAPLRVAYYGRSDSIRRRITNNEEVVEFLRNFTRPPLEVYFIDEMLASGETSYSMPDMLRLYTQTDILVIAHGASAWSTFLMPDGAGLVEIFGPCNWSVQNASDISIMKTWIKVVAGALRLKHDISNPFGEAIPDPNRGNTTLCKDPYSGVPNYTVDTEKLGKIINAFAYPDRPGDRLTQHWLHDWEQHI